MRPDVVTFWHGPLDGLRLTCLRSQVAAGHNVTVYSFDPLPGLPDGVGNAEAWCKDCHAIEAVTAGARGRGPDFVAIANRTSTTGLSLKVFMKTSHHQMPNLIITPSQADDLTNYILSLKRD